MLIAVVSYEHDENPEIGTFGDLLWSEDPINDRSDPYRYLVAFYWSLTTFTTVGYGDLVAKLPAEMIWSIAMMLMGSTAFAWLSGTHHVYPCLSLSHTHTMAYNPNNPDNPDNPGYCSRDIHSFMLT